METSIQDIVDSLGATKGTFYYYFASKEELLIESGELRSDLNPSVITFGILGVLNWSYQWFNPEGAISESELADMFVEMIMKGIEKGGVEYKLPFF